MCCYRLLVLYKYNKDDHRKNLILYSLNIISQKKMNMDLDECNCTTFGLSIYAYTYLYMCVSNNNTRLM